MIRNGEGVLSKIYYPSLEEFVVDDQVLKNVYDWALENKFINLDDVAQISNNIKPDDFNYFNNNNNKSFGRCAAAVLGCAGGALINPNALELLPCVAAAVEGGLDPFADAWCEAQYLGTAFVGFAACWGATNLACAKQAPDPTVMTPGTAGPNRGSQTNGKCDANARVNKVQIWSRGGLVTKIKGTCTDGSDFTVGTGNGSSTVKNCGNGHMASGVYGMSGSYIDSFGIFCDEVAEDGNKFQGIGTVGGSGGGQYSLKCSEGDGHLYGIDARETWHYLKKNRKFRYIKPLCKSI